MVSNPGPHLSCYMKCVDFLKSGTLSEIDSGSTALKMARECNLVAALFPAAFAGSCVVLAGAVGQKLWTQLVCDSAAVEEAGK